MSIRFPEPDPGVVARRDAIIEGLRPLVAAEALVTLARLNRSARPEDVAMFLSGTALAPVRFTAREVVLFSARASTGGGPYVAEAVFPFA